MRDFLTLHDQGSFSDFFCVGSTYTTPHLCSIEARWQFPWRSLLLIMGMTLFSLFFMLMEHFARINIFNERLFASSLFIQSLIIPVGLVSLLSEFNLWRNITFFRVLSMVGMGGMLSIVFTVLLTNFQLTNIPFMAGLIEEPAKIAAALLLAGSVGRKNASVLHGLLYGGAVGAGFTIFESTGYAFEALHAPVNAGLAEHLDYQKAQLVMATRSLFFLTAGHVTWTAITCGALWNSLRGRTLCQALRHPLFLFFLTFAILIHGYWNISINRDIFIYMLPLFAFCSWGLIAILIQMGIQQIRALQNYWLSVCGRSEKSIWLLSDEGPILGPYTAETIMEMRRDKKISLEQRCIIGSPITEPHSIARLSFIPTQDATEKYWYEISPPLWSKIVFILNLACVGSMICFFFLPIISLFTYFICGLLIFAILLTVVVRLWSSKNLPLGGHDEYGELMQAPPAWQIVFGFIIPLYNIYWGYVVGSHVLRRVNLIQAPHMRIPSWIPQFFWFTFCAGALLAGALLIYHTNAFLPYLVVLIFLFPLSATLVSLAFASAAKSLRQAP